MLKPMTVQELGEPFYVQFLYTNVIPFKLGSAFTFDFSTCALNKFALGLDQTFILAFNKFTLG